MTSRVQKGSAVFRPLAKQRSRPIQVPNLPNQNFLNNETQGLATSTSTSPPSSSAPTQLQGGNNIRQPTQPQVSLHQTQPSTPASTPIGVPLSFSPTTTLPRPPSIVPSNSLSIPGPTLASHPTPPLIHVQTRSTPALLPKDATPHIQNSASSESQTHFSVLKSGAMSGNSQIEVGDTPPEIQAQVATTNAEPSSSKIHFRSVFAGEQAGEERGATQTAVSSEKDGTRRFKRKRNTVTIIEASERGESVGGPDADGVEVTENSTSKKAKEPKGKGKASSLVTKPKRKTRKSTAAESSSTTDGSSKPLSRKRTTRAHSKTPFGPLADPGAELDPTQITMAALCEDTGQGRVSSKAAEILSNHEAWKKDRKERRARLKLIMEKKKHGLAEDDEDDRGAGKEKEKELEKQADNENLASPTIVLNAEEPANPDENPENFDYSQSLQRSRFNVQVRIGPNGETIIDEESLVVDRAEGEQGEGEYEKVIESDMTKFVNSGTYGKRFRGSRWSREETELFYDALAQYGENYELISYVLPGRDRKACKNKFKAEDKRDPGRINRCLNNRIPVDFKTLARMTGKDFSGPTPQITAPPPPPSTERSIGANAAQTINSGSFADRGRKEKPGNISSSKRSRSRTAVLEDGVEVLGDVDAYEIDD